MKRVTEILLILILVLCVCCERDSIKATSVVGRSFTTSDNRQAVSLWFGLEGYNEAQRLEIRSPGEDFTWSLPVSVADYEGRQYTGSADAVMPPGVSLPAGQWSYTLVFRDGRTLEGVFELN